MKEQALLAAVQTEGMDALKSAYQNYRMEFLHFGRKYGLSEAVLLDIYQDAFVITYENIVQRKLQNLKSSLKTYVFAVGKNLMRAELRKQSKSNNLELTEHDRVVGNTFLAKVELNHQQSLIREALGQMGEKCRTILLLFYYQQHSIEAIMHRMGYESENVVKASKSRCMKRLRAFFAQKTS